MKQVFILIAALFTATIGASLSDAHAQQTDSLRIVAVVNDDVISAYDLATRVELVIALSNLEDRPGIRRQMAPEILRSLIAEKLHLQAAEEAGVTVEPAEIDAAIANIEKRNNLPPGGLFAFLERRNLDIETLIQQLRADIAWSRTVFRRYSSQIDVNETELNAAVARAEAALGKPEYEVSEIFLGVDNPSKEGETRAQAQRLIRELEAGASFPSLAQSFSQSPTAASGGNLGWVRGDDLPSEVMAELERMEVGRIVGPIKVSGGFYIIALRNKRIAGQKRTGETTVSLSQLHFSLPSDAPEETVLSYVNSALDRTRGIDTCEKFEAVGKEYGSPLSGSLGSLPITRLPEQIRVAVADLPVYGMTPPIRSQDALVVLMVCDRTDPKIETAEVDRDAIERRLMDRRLDTFARQYMRELRRNAYIEIR